MSGRTMSSCRRSLEGLPSVFWLAGAADGSLRRSVDPVATVLGACSWKLEIHWHL